jgi:hypothetical protein
MSGGTGVRENETGRAIEPAQHPIHHLSKLSVAQNEPGHARVVHNLDVRIIEHLAEDEPFDPHVEPDSYQFVHLVDIGARHRCDELDRRLGAWRNEARQVPRHQFSP